MSGRAADVSRYPTVEFMLHAVAAWIGKIRMANGIRDELGKCSAEEKKQIAKDLGIPVEDLRRLVAKGPLRRTLCRKCYRHFPSTRECWRAPIPRSCGTCNERAPFATIKACVNANSPRVPPLEISVSSVPTLIRWTHFMNGSRPRYAVEIATVESAGRTIPTPTTVTIRRSPQSRCRTERPMSEPNAGLSKQRPAILSKDVM
jgi:hypothetical protein